MSACADGEVHWIKDDITQRSSMTETVYTSDHAGRPSPYQTPRGDLHPSGYVATNRSPNGAPGSPRTECDSVYRKAHVAVTQRVAIGILEIIREPDRHDIRLRRELDTRHRLELRLSHKVPYRGSRRLPTASWQVGRHLRQVEDRAIDHHDAWVT